MRDSPITHDEGAVRRDEVDALRRTCRAYLRELAQYRALTADERRVVRWVPLAAVVREVEG